ncbi:MAG: hypothetical protein KZQ93_05190 [Candidatus Thiodiazotropha sp. (ex Monitilora ramsayi)]|nr:hypothetical protein [Candidatus Thiodiazotropha sp. (ex Monitilora ramsayi)]
MSDLERRMSIHLSILALMGESGFSPTGRDAERFLFFGVALQSHDEELLYETCTLALDQILDESLTDAPVVDAFTLFPPSTELMLKLYQERREVRAVLFSLWHRLGIDLPAGLVNQAELQHEDKHLQYEMMTYTANNPFFRVDLFRTYYGPLLKPAGRFPLHESLLEPVLWAGMVRGDTDASNALRRAVEEATAPEVKAGLLRLMALNGAPDQLPVLLESFERSTSFDSRWWALAGTAECTPHLIQQLGQPEFADRVHDDWIFLTNVALPERPALMLVDEEGDRVDPDAELENRVKLVPDAHYAQSWWEANRAVWGEQRWVMGQPATPEWLFDLCLEYAGEFTDDLTDLLALKLQRPLGLGCRWGWQDLRLNALAVLKRSSLFSTPVNQLR